MTQKLIWGNPDETHWRTSNPPPFGFYTIHISDHSCKWSVAVLTVRRQTLGFAITAVHRLHPLPVLVPAEECHARMCQVSQSSNHADSPGPGSALPPRRSWKERTLWAHRVPQILGVYSVTQWASTVRQDSERGHVLITNRAVSHTDVGCT